MNPQLTVEALDVAYGEFQVLWDAALQVAAGEIVALLGPNGAGKSTLVNTISGLLHPRAGSITFEARRIDGMPAHRSAAIGIAHVLERRRLFPFLTVHDNVLLGGHNPRARPHRDETLERLEALLPLLKARRSQLAHTLSGGEQQMVAVGRALMAEPRILLLDEPSGGLSPRLVDEIADTIQMLKAAGTTMLMVEQNLHLAFKAADRFIILRDGVVIDGGAVSGLNGSHEDIVRSIYL
jgi:branched-chain amino acid transport system ATP-binding protein